MMKKAFSIVSVFLAIFLLMVPALDARGGRGGGRGGGGGRQMSRGGGRSVSRSPSMSRSSRSRPSHSRPKTSRPQTRPSRPTTGRPQTRPSQGMASRPSTGQRPGGKTPTRNDVQKFLSSQPSGRPATRPVERPGQGPGQRPGDRPGGRPGERPGQRPGDRHDFGEKVRDEIGKNRPNRGDWFDDNFWDRHHRPPYYDRHNNWWKWATAAGVAGWLGWRSTPVYYGGYYTDDGYYWGTSDETGTTTDYATQTEAIETATSEQTSDEWMPLGVFALSKEGEVKATPNIYLQLALNKDGMISGTYYNSTTDETYEAEGLVDQNSQIAAWKIIDNDSSPILETGVYNLTQSEAPVRVHFEDGRTQELMLVRLEEAAS